jgi:hypothetical protein
MLIIFCLLAVEPTPYPVEAPDKNPGLGAADYPVI